MKLLEFAVAPLATANLNYTKPVCVCATAASRREREGRRMNTQPESTTPRDCDEFQQQLPELFDSEENMLAHAHLQSCKNCSSLGGAIWSTSPRRRNCCCPSTTPVRRLDNIQHALSHAAKDGNKSS